MRPFLLFCLLFFLGSTVEAQTGTSCPLPPGPETFLPIQRFLSSPALEGRETGTNGADVAAEYISSMMELTGLKPLGDRLPPFNTKDSSATRSWFQKFRICRQMVNQATLTITRTGHGKPRNLTFRLEKDFILSRNAKSLSGGYPVVFAGYGLDVKELSVNDYRDIETRHQVVLILEGFPGLHDTTTEPGKTLHRLFPDPESLEKAKVEWAILHGAAAVIMVNPSWTDSLSYPEISSGDDYAGWLPADTLAEPFYMDHDYYFPGKGSDTALPLFRLNNAASEALSSLIGLIPSEKKNGPATVKASRETYDIACQAEFSITRARDTITVSNVPGLLPGADTSRYLLVGAHYDHLGMRGDHIWCGADDNASGVAGMLALAKAWAECPLPPPCNLLFVAWGAEEKGVLGSEFFANTSPLMDKISLVINMDMISRSAPGDSASNVVSIGTLPASKDLRSIAMESNAKLEKPFTLDLWNVTGHCGSDYCHFASRNIPVITLFSGFHDDYHTPQDTFDRTDPERMEKILSIVNNCIIEHISTSAH